MTLPADQDLAHEQFPDLNREFYQADPADYLARRARSVILAIADSPALDQVLADGVRYGVTEIRRDPVSRNDDTNRADDAYAALEATNLLHHAAECFLRLYLAHGDRQACPWLEVARLRVPRHFKERVEALRDSLTEQVTIDSLRHVFFGNSDPTAMGWTASPEEWQRKTDGLTMLIGYLCDTVLGDAAMYNATKHGLAAVGGEHELGLSTPGDDLVIHTEGLALTFLDVRPLQDSSGRKRWHRCTTFVSVEANLGVVEIIRLFVATLWGIARYRYTGDQPQGMPVMMIEPDVLQQVLRTGRGDDPIQFSSMAMELAYYLDPAEIQNDNEPDTT